MSFTVQATRHVEWVQFSTGTKNLIKFIELGQLPVTPKLERLNEGHDIETATVASNAQYHHERRLRYNNTKFIELGQLPVTPKLERLNEGHDIETATVASNAQYHHERRLRYNNTKLQRAEKTKNQDRRREP